MAKRQRPWKESDASTTSSEIQRATAKSMQPRLDPKKAFSSILGWLRIVEMDAPPVSVNSMRRDKWLREVWKKEPHLAGVVNSVTLIDSNRGWELVGGRNQVKRYTDILHEADGGAGWRMFMRRSSLSYWCTDLGSISEVGRDGRNGPLRALWHVDSARCYLTGKPETPLCYQPALGGQQAWQPQDYFRVASLPSDDEALLGLGYCAISRVVETLRLLYAVMLHDQEQVAARAPKGLLLLQGISEEQWTQSLQARDESLAALDRRYYGGVQVLASAGLEQLDAKLIALSQLPANFDAKVFVDLAMYTFALCFGYDPSEFWPVEFGSLGRGTETEIQHVKATGKGGHDFALSLQERLQGVLPETLHWEFEQRDDAGEMTEQQVKQAKLATVTTAYESGIIQGASLISRQEARQLLAEAGIIPAEWTITDEEVTATDTEDSETDAEATSQPADQTSGPASPGPADQQALETPQVQRAMAVMPYEPIVRYRWSGGRAALRTIYAPGRHVWRGHRMRAATEPEVLYKSGDVVITTADVDDAIADARRRVGAEFAELLTAPELTPDQLAKWA